MSMLRQTHEHAVTTLGAATDKLRRFVTKTFIIRSIIMLMEIIENRNINGVMWKNTLGVHVFSTRS